jgi:medium-chain acyl-[acyl-carrier-protein] hydrolase
MNPPQEDRLATAVASAWLEPIRQSNSSRLSLFCFPYAGGSAAAFRGWHAAAPADVDVWAVQLPGRGKRFRETLLRRMPALVEAAGHAVAPMTTRPFVFYGHSMGAVLSFEIARWLRGRGLPTPERLLVSGRGAPHLPFSSADTYRLPDAEFIAYLRELNGTPTELLEDAEARALLLPVIRADFEAVQTHVFTPGAPLSCPIHVYGGAADVTLETSHLQEWRQHTTAESTCDVFPGDHFFIEDPNGAFLRRVHEHVEKALTGVFRKRETFSTNPQTSNAS